MREAFRCNGWATDKATIFYKAHERYSYTEMCEQFDIKPGMKPLPVDGKYRPSIHMPRWASRIHLEITDIRVERLKDITYSDAIQEGLTVFNEDGNLYYSGSSFDPNTWFEEPEKWHCDDPIQAFYELWDGINFERGCGVEKNPWVWVVEFKRLS